MAPRSASAKAPGPANISPNGWSTARPRSICANSIRGGSAAGQAATIREGHRHRGLSSYVLLLPARRAACGGPAGAQVEPVRASRRGRGAVPAGHGLGARRAGTTKAARASAFPSAAAIGGPAGARNAWRCAMRSGSWTCRASPNSSSGARARTRCSSHLCANRIPGRDGGIVLAHMLTDDGFIESELTITRLADDHYFLLSAATAELQDEDRLRQALPSDGALHARQCHRGLWHARPCRTALARGPRRPHRRRSRQRRLPLADRADHHGRRGRERPGAADQLCRRARLRAPLPDGGDAGRVRSADARRRARTASSCSAPMR